MAVYSSADKNFGGIPGIMFRDLLELDIGQHSLKNQRKILWGIHCWICAENPEDADEAGNPPAGCKETLGQLRDINDAQLKELVVLNKYDSDVPIDDPTRDKYTLALEAVEYRLKQIIKRGKLVDNVKPGQGPPLPL